MRLFSHRLDNLFPLYSLALVFLYERVNAMLARFYKRAQTDDEKSKFFSPVINLVVLCVRALIRRQDGNDKKKIIISK